MKHAIHSPALSTPSSQFRARLRSSWLWLAVGAILLAVLATSLPVLRADFVHDDFVQIGVRHFDAQELAKQDSWEYVGEMFARWGILAPITKRAILRPLRDWSIWTDYFISGLNPLGYHLTDLALHVLTSWAVTLLMWRLTRARWASLLAGVLFAVMPIHAEAVAFISSRGHVMAGLFMTLGVVFYTFPPTRWTIFWTCLVFVLALFSKETALALPLLLALYDLVYRRREGLRAFVRRAAPIWLTLFAYLLLRVSILGLTAGTPSPNTIVSWDYLLSGYALYAVDPLITDIALWQAFLVVALFWLALIFYRARREVVFGLLWIPLPLLAAITFPPQERYFYVPSVGMSLALASILADPLPALPRWSRPLGAALAALLIVIYGATLIRLNENWEIAARAARRIVTQVQTLHPQLPPRARLVFVGVPPQIRRAYVFINPLEIQYALALAYNDSSLTADLAPNFPLLTKNLERTFFFEYDPPTLREREDLVAALRARKSCGDTSALTWTFDGDAEGGEAWHEIENLSAAQGALIMQSQGGDPFLASPILEIPASQFKDLELVMSVESNTKNLTGELYWQTREMSDFSPAPCAALCRHCRWRVSHIYPPL